MEQYIFVGSGIASISAIEAVRKVDQQSQIILISQEKSMPYNRMQLTKGYLINQSQNRLWLKKDEWYDQMDVTLLLDTRVDEIDMSNKQVILSNQKKLIYSKLFIGSGSHNKVPVVMGIEKKGCFTLRNLADAEAIIQYLEETKRQAVVVGGGVQGLEIAWNLLQMGHDVKILELQGQVMAGQVHERDSEKIIEKCEEYGGQVLLSTFITEIRGQNQIQEVLTNTGEVIPCDMVIYSIGIGANGKFIDKIDKTSDGWIKVNDKMETSQGGIYAGGDIASCEGEHHGLWAAAMTQGQVAGKQMAGQSDVTYQGLVPTMNLHAFKIQLAAIGSGFRQEVDSIVHEEEGDKSYTICYEDQHIVGFTCIGDMKPLLKLKKAIEGKRVIQKEDSKSIKDLLESLS